MTQNVQDAIAHRKFNPGTEDTVASELKAALELNPKSIPYAFHIEKQQPGYLAFSYLTTKRLKRDWIRITPSGFVHKGVPGQTDDKSYR